MFSSCAQLAWRPVAGLQSDSSRRKLPAEKAFAVLCRTLNFDRWERESAQMTSAEALDLQLSDTEIEAHRGSSRASCRLSNRGFGC